MDAHFAIDAYLEFLQAIGLFTILIVSIGITHLYRKTMKKLDDPTRPGLGDAED